MNNRVNRAGRPAGITMIEVLVASTLLILVIYAVSQYVGTSQKLESHATYTQEFTENAQGLARTRNISQTLGSVLLPNNHNLGCATAPCASGDPYDQADLSNVANCVSAVFVAGTKSPSHILFPLVLKDSAGNPIGRNVPGTNLTVVGRFTYLAGCIAVPSSPPPNLKPCLTIQGALPKDPSAVDPYSVTFILDPFNQRPWDWRPLYPLADCGVAGN
jgi:Tfp pilus assembly protein PilV